MNIFMPSVGCNFMLFVYPIWKAILWSKILSALSLVSIRLFHFGKSCVPTFYTPMKIVILKVAQQGVLLCPKFHPTQTRQLCPYSHKNKTLSFKSFFLQGNEALLTSRTKTYKKEGNLTKL